MNIKVHVTCFRLNIKYSLADDSIRGHKKGQTHEYFQVGKVSKGLHLKSSQKRRKGRVSNSKTGHGCDMTNAEKPWATTYWEKELELMYCWEEMLENRQNWERQAESGEQHEARSNAKTERSDLSRRRSHGSCNLWQVHAVSQHALKLTHGIKK